MSHNIGQNDHEGLPFHKMRYLTQEHFDFGGPFTFCWLRVTLQLRVN